MDKVRALKIENSSEGGGQNDPFPTEVNPTQDLLSAKGMVLNDNNSFLLEHKGRTISFSEPYTTTKVTYLANGEIDVVEYYNSDTQINANRIYKTTITYDGSLNPTTETTLIYDTDGTTTLKTYTLTYSYSGVDLSTGTMNIT